MPPKKNIKGHPIPAGSVNTAARGVAGYNVTRAAISALPGVAVDFFAQAIDAQGSPVLGAGRVLTVIISAGAGGTLAASSVETDAQGIATITLTVGPVVGTVYRIKVTDVNGKTGTSPNLTVVYDTTPTSILLSPLTLALAIGGTGQLTATLRNASTGPVDGTVSAWRSSDTAVARVSSTGLVTAVASGTATIVATFGNLTSTECAVTVAAAAIVATRYIVTPSTLTPAVGQQIEVPAQLATAAGAAVATAGIVVTATKTGAGGSFASATATTDARGIATFFFVVALVDSVNHVISVSDGSGRVGSSAVINIAPDLTPTTVAITPTTLALIAGGSPFSGPLAATITNAGGTILPLAPTSWVSDTPAVATVDTTTGRVTAVAAGSARVTARYNGITSGACAVTVTAAAGDPGGPGDPGGGILLARGDFEDGTLGPFSAPSVWLPSISVVNDPTPRALGKVARIQYQNNPPAQIDSDIGIFPGIELHAGETIWHRCDFYIGPTARMDFNGPGQVQRKFNYFGYNGVGPRSSNFVFIAFGPQIYLSFSVLNAAETDKYQQAFPNWNGAGVYLDVGPPFGPSGFNMQRSQWYRTWCEIKLSSDYGVADGVTRLWVQPWSGATPPASKGTALFDQSNVVWFHPDRASLAPISAMKWAMWGIGYQINASLQQIEDRYFDNVCFATTEAALGT